MAVVTSAEVLSVIKHGEDIREFILKPKVYKRFEAGTFLQLTLENVTASEIWPDSRTFSIASCYNKDKTIRLIIKKVGVYTGRLFDELIEGSECTIKYSFGDFLLPVFDKENPIVCIAGGTGIAPFLSFLGQLKNEGSLDKMYLLYSVKKFENFIDIDILRSNLPDNQTSFHCTREEVDGFKNDRINLDEIIKISQNNKDAHYYICGSKEFITDFKGKLFEKGFNNVYTDEWE